MVFVEFGERNVVVDLDKAEKIVDGVQDIISEQNEPRVSIEIDYVENGGQQPYLQRLRWIIYQEDWDDDKDHPS